MDTRRTRRLPLVVVAAAGEEGEQVQEEVDDIEIELDRGDDEVVDAELADDVVRVVDDEAAEDERADEREDLVV